MWLSVPWATGGWSIISPLNLLTTLPLMIFAARVSPPMSLEQACVLFAPLVKTCVSAKILAKISRLLVPKFQGENFYKNRAIVDEMKKLASRKGCTLAQIAIAWVAAQGMIPIPGTTKPERLVENWGSRDVELTEEEKQDMRRIVDAAKPLGNRYSAVHQSWVGH